MTTHRNNLPIFIFGVIGVLVLISAYQYFSYTPVTTQSDNSAILSLEEDIMNGDVNLSDYIALVSLYTQLVRETSDTSYYADIDRILLDARNRYGDDEPELLIARATLAAGTHHFLESYNLSVTAIEKKPNKALYYGVQADALIELGRYNEAETTLQKMVDLRPDYNAYIRIAYLRELHGDIGGALEMIDLALGSGSGIAEHMAWAYVERGRLQFGTNLEVAKASFEFALDTFPDYTPALVWLGKVAYAENDTRLSKMYFEKAFTLAPTITHAEVLYYFSRIEGQSEAAEKYATLVEAGYQTLEAGGSSIDLEYALFLSEKGTDLEAALARATRAYEERPAIYTADVLSRVHYARNEFEKAQELSDVALTLPSADATFYYHRALIEEALGNTAETEPYIKTAWVLNPHDSIMFKHKNNFTKN